jgi:hypothetical protein
LYESLLVDRFDVGCADSLKQRRVIAFFMVLGEFCCFAAEAIPDANFMAFTVTYELPRAALLRNPRLS